jgi:UbiD family decarboxylase
MSESPSLRTFLKDLERERPDDVFRVEGEISLDYEITAISLLMEKRGNPVIYCNKVKGWSGRAVTNVFGTRERMAFALGVSDDKLFEKWHKGVNNPIPPKVIEGGEVREMVWTDDEVDLSVLPANRHFVGDAGRYITSGIIVAKDPESKRRNMSFHRLLVKGRNRLGTSLHSRGDLWYMSLKADKVNRPLPVSIFIGSHPAIYMAAASKLPYGYDEFGLAGALLSEPVELSRGVTVDVEAPANAEIIIEGNLLPRIREDEGPFGEYTGYMSGRSTRHVIEVTGIFMRRDAIYQDITPGNSSEHLLLGRIGKEAIVFNKVKSMYPNVRAVNWPNSGTHYHAYVSLSEPVEPGVPNQLGLLLLSLDPYLKLVIIVDDDIDVNNEGMVLWALATRVQADRDVNIVRNVFMNKLDPSSSGEGTSSKMIIDATKKGIRVEPLRIPDEVWRKVRKLVERYER